MLQMQQKNKWAYDTIMQEVDKMIARNEWNGFNEGEWCYEINVSNFIKKNYKVYTDGEEFLEGPTNKTKKILKIYEDICKEDIGGSICESTPKETPNHRKYS